MERLNDKLLQHMYLTHRLKSEETKTKIYRWIVSQEENMYIQIKKWYDDYIESAEQIEKLQQSCDKERKIYDEYMVRSEETIRQQRIELESVKQELSRKVVELEEMTRQREVYYARYETAVQECSLKEALHNVHRETTDISVLFKKQRYELEEFKILIKKEVLKREEGGEDVLAMLRALLHDYNQKFETELRKHEERVRYISVTQIAEINNERQEVRTKYNDLVEKHMNLSLYYEREKILRSDLERAMKLNELAFSERVAELRSEISDLGFWHIPDDFYFDLELEEEGKWLDIKYKHEKYMMTSIFLMEKNKAHPRSQSR
ncbi:uncharacterized protein [Ptychodera flava]|uniref:uncharacterized protein n=1 Tax=Ptychodera flava TaxID=63121 RepID=UPI00396A48D3